MKEYLVVLYKEGYEQTGACNAMTISVKDPLELKDKIEKIMAEQNYVSFCFTKKENMLDITVLDFCLFKHKYETLF